METQDPTLETAARRWVVPLVTGVLFLILAFVVLSYDTTSVGVVSVLIGISLLLAGFGWLALAGVVSELRWLLIVGGLLSIGAAIAAFVYPDETLKVLGLILGWFLLVSGILQVALAFTNREREHWWLGLVSGAVMFALGAWAVREPDRSVVLLLTLVGVFLILRGLGDIILAFRLRSLKKELAASA